MNMCQILECEIVLLQYSPIRIIRNDENIISELTERRNKKSCGLRNIHQIRKIFAIMSWIIYISQWL